MIHAAFLLIAVVGCLVAASCAGSAWALVPTTTDRAATVAPESRTRPGLRVIRAATARPALRGNAGEGGEGGGTSAGAGGEGGAGRDDHPPDIEPIVWGEPGVPSEVIVYVVPKILGGDYEEELGILIARTDGSERHHLFEGTSPSLYPGRFSAHLHLRRFGLGLEVERLRARAGDRRELFVLVRGRRIPGGPRQRGHVGADDTRVATRPLR